MIIDAHQHVWNLSRADYPWLDAQLAPIDRTMELEQIAGAMGDAGVGATVLVQAADNPEDSAYMRSVADAHPEVVGIVAWVALDDADRAAVALDEWRDDRRVIGVRTQLHALPDTEWILRADVDEGLSLLESRELSFDYVTGGPAALAYVPLVSSRHPQLTIVIDHLGKPPIGGTAAEHARWRQLIAAAAENPRVVAKLSGLYSSVGPLDSWTLESVRPFVDDALEIFGPHRLMVGGDWPISVLAGGYDRTWRAVRLLTDGLDVAGRAAVLGGTATSVYRLDPAVLAIAADHWTSTPR